MARFLWICLGGALGTGARYLLSGWLAEAWGPGFPVGTLAINVLGSFLLGLIMQVALTTELIPPTLRLFLSTGLIGGFTTYSSFNYETLKLFQDSAWGLGALNLAVTVLSCLGAGLLGLHAGRLLFGT
jgi:CrcB protein